MVPFWQLSAVLFALAPAVLLAIVLVRLGQGSLSPKMLGVSMAFGVLAACASLLLTKVEPLLLPHVGILGKLATTAFVFAGLVEESAKLAVTLVFIYPYVRADHARRMILAAAAVALGFALLENVGIVLRAAASWERTAVARAFLSVPFHTLLGLYVGGGLVRAKGLPGASAAFCIARTLFFASLLHGCFDLPLFLGASSPVFPTPVNHIASAFSLPTVTFLNVCIFVVLAVLCLAVIKAMIRVVRQEASATGEALKPRPIPSGLAGRAGPLLTGILVIFAATLVALTAEALDSGAALTVVLPGADIALILATFAALLVAASGWSIRTALLAGGTTAIGAVGAGFVLFVFDAARRSALAAILVASARFAAASGDLDLASRNTATAMTLTPDSIPVLAMRVGILNRQRRFDVAYGELSRVLSRHPDDTSLLALRAQESLNRRDDERADADVDRALGLDPGNVALHHLRFSALLGRDKLPDADTELGKLAGLGAPGIMEHLDRAFLAVRRKDAMVASTEFGEAIRIAPADASGWASRGRFRFDQGDFRGAVSDLAAAASRGNDPYVALALFDALSKAGVSPYRAFTFWAPLLNRIYWPGPLVEFYLGQRTMPATIAAARTGEERCEAYFYIAEWFLNQGQRGFALPMLKAAVPLCPLSYVEHDAAAAEITRLETVPGKPAFASIHPPAKPQPPPERAQPWVPPAAATLGGKGCNATGDAVWRFAGAEPAGAVPASLEVSIAIPSLMPEARLDVVPDKDGGSFLVTLSASSTQGGFVIDQPGDVKVRDSRFASQLDMTPFKGFPNASFRAGIGRDAIVQDLDVILRGLVVELPLRTSPNGLCSLFLRIDDGARSAVRDAETSWKALLAAGAH
jgi:RsiW-degrading membrane proteinase PrsW (M82 family)/tetratricopeptide (TPR) repeat protein